jgi:hypothetical protein
MEDPLTIVMAVSAIVGIIKGILEIRKILREEKERNAPAVLPDEGRITR